MKIAILGTGTVGQTLAVKLVSLGHDAMLGTRDVKETLSRTENDMYGNPGFAIWYPANSQVKLGTFAQAVAFAEIIFNATQGGQSVKALSSAKEADLSGKIIVDIANPLDYSKGMPPGLIPELSNTNSLGEEIQKRFPGAKVVKTLNTMWCGLMVNPGMIAGGDHTNFICGNDNDAKSTVRNILHQFGWKDENILDIGDITGARGCEGVLPIWLKTMVALQTAAFNFRITR